MKINNLQELRAEKQRLNIESEGYLRGLQDDADKLKRMLAPLELARKLIASFLPHFMRAPKFMNGPLGFISKAIFGAPEKKEPPKEEPAKAGKIRDVAVGILETAASVLISKYIRRKF